MILPDIRVDVTGAIRDLRLTGAELRKATAAALTRTADESVAALRRDLPDHFTIRTPWVAKGFRVQRAAPKTLAARVWHKDPFMARQAEGGTKDGQGGGDVAVPVLGRTAGETRTKVTRPRDWPGRLPHTYAIPRQDGTTLIFQRPRRRGRKGIGAARQPALPSRLMYVLTPQVDVPKRWPFRETVGAVVQKRWALNLEGMANAVLRTRGQGR